MLVNLKLCGLIYNKICYRGCFKALSYKKTLWLSHLKACLKQMTMKKNLNIIALSFYFWRANLNPKENRSSPHLFITSADTGETDNKDFNNLQVNTVHPKHFPWFCKRKTFMSYPRLHNLLKWYSNCTYS